MTKVAQSSACLCTEYVRTEIMICKTASPSSGLLESCPSTPTSSSTDLLINSWYADIRQSKK